MPGGEFAIRWTIRLAVACYLAAVALRILGPRGPGKWENLARFAWTAGCLLFLAHAAAAFHFRHHWSHAQAYQHIAERTAEYVGIGWGGGVYLNYLFGLVWLADAAWWWLAPAAFRLRPAWVGWPLQAFMLFMVVNGAVVFAPPAVRWPAAAAGLALASAWLARHVFMIGKHPVAASAEH